MLGPLNQSTTAEPPVGVGLLRVGTVTVGRPPGSFAVDHSRTRVGRPAGRELCSRGVDHASGVLAPGAGTSATATGPGGIRLPFVGGPFVFGYGPDQGDHVGRSAGAIDFDMLPSNHDVIAGTTGNVVWAVPQTTFCDPNNPTYV